MDLVPMAFADFDVFIQRAIVHQAHERVTTDFLSLETARLVAQTGTERILSAGIHTPNHYFYNLVTDAICVGQAWLHINRSDKLAWLYFLHIEPAQRQQGFGGHAMTAIKAQAKALGAQVFWLNVVQANSAAQALYRQAGLEIAAFHMNCQL